MEMNFTKFHKVIIYGQMPSDYLICGILSNLT